MQDHLIFIVGCVLFISIVEYVPSRKLHCYTEEVKRIEGPIQSNGGNM